MNYLVFIKQVPDTTTRIQLSSDQKSVDLSAVKWIMNPYDEFAVEEAIRKKEQDLKSEIKSEVTVCTIGPARSKDILRTALAMGADKGIHLEVSEDGDALSYIKKVEETLKDVLQQTDIIFCGRHSIDWNGSLFGPMLAECLSWPSVFPVQKVQRKSESLLEVHRSLEGGAIEILEIQGPVVLCINKGCNEPRLPSLPQIMKAKNKPIETKSAESLEPSLLSIKSFSFPKDRKPVQIIEGSPKEQAQKLVQILREKEGLI